ncbi:MAG TPA: BTAD domain-containing putative transcriptional regulator [Dongiaceae bacterium]|jgi:TolB-like protein/Tfp pilus assembly protein PilF|nr:BTAD domain-containing putative transcriptional regulator [Dongiaceae bacterium]
MALVRLSLFGGFGLRRSDGGDVRLPTRKAEALLAFLACHPGERQPRDRLTALLWGDRGDRQARHSLSQTLLSIRQAFDGADSLLVVERETVAACAEAIDSDVIDFRRLADPQGDLRSALDLYRGPFLDGFNLREAGFEEWITEQRARLHGMAFDAFLALADTQTAGGDWNAAIATLNGAIRFDPLAEEAYRRLMRAQIEHGLRNDAIRAYRCLADTLRRELNTQPDPSTIVLYQSAMARPKPMLLQAPVDAATDAEIMPRTQATADHGEGKGPHRASIAIMPFTDPDSGLGAKILLARGLTHDVITRLAKLRSLFVIAQGTIFALAEKGVGAEEAGRLLNVEYVVSGTLRYQDGRVTITIELVETRCDRIVWAEKLECKLGDSLTMEDEIINQIVSSIASEIEIVERNRAILKPPSSLDAWEALHCGFWHMYRFNEVDNERAKRFFKLAVRLDPTMARAYAGLSFTHFQNAFLLRLSERQQEIGRAYEMACESLIADDRDPAAHWAMGRALWLRGDHEQSLRELDSAVKLSPNFALGHYTLSFVHCQSGDAAAAIRYADRSHNLSPYDPMTFAMLGAKALAHARLGQFEQAAEWSIKATLRPNAHTHIVAIAAQCLALADRGDEARAYSSRVRQARPEYSIEDFLSSFHFPAKDAATFRSAAMDSGIFQFGKLLRSA